MTALLARLHALRIREEAQDTIEYLLATGVVVVAVVGAVAFGDDVVGAVEGFVETAIEGLFS